MSEADYGAMYKDVRPVAEFGARFMLPVSLYPMTLNVDDVAATEVKRKVVDNEEVETGGNPYVALAGLVADGPFKGKDMTARVNLTVGKSGGYLGKMIATCKAITGKDPLWAAMGEYGFPIVDGDTKAKQLATGEHYVSLDPESRLDFMVKLVRVAEWSKKLVVVSVTHEAGEKKNADGSTQWFMRMNGFYPLNDPKKGKDYLLKVAFPEQEAAKAAMGGDGGE